MDITCVYRLQLFYQLDDGQCTETCILSEKGTSFCTFTVV